MTIETPAWVRHAVFYEIFPDRFARPARGARTARRAPLVHDESDDSQSGSVVPWDEDAFEPWDAKPNQHAYKGGNLDGATEKLAWLEDLGVNAIYLAPVFVSPTHHRYKPLDHYRVDPLLGGDAAFDRFVAEVHRRGMRVILDGVFSHVGLGFPRFQDVLEYGERSPWRRWFRIERFPLNPWDLSHPAGYRSWEDHRSMPQLDHDEPAVREYLYDVAEHWVGRGIDGWRFDAPEIVTTPGFWQEMRARLKALRDDLYLVGEIWTEATQWLDGTQWDGVMNYPLTGLLRWFAAHRHLQPQHLHAAARPDGLLDGPRFANKVEVLIARYPWAIAQTQLNLLNSHDLGRFITVAGGDRRSVELASALLFTLPGAPCILYGDEVGLSGGISPDSRRGFPDPERWDLPLLSLHRELIALRRTRSPLAEGEFRTLAARDFGVAFERRIEAERIVVAVNAGDAPVELPVALARFECSLLEIGRVEMAATRVILGPRSAVILGAR